MVKFRYILLLLLLVSGCASPQEKFEKQLDKAMDEEIQYSEFYSNGFSVSYPMWPKADSVGVELSVTKGYCSVAVNSEKMDAKQWYDMLLDSVEENGELIDSDGLHAIYSMPYQNLTMISDTEIFECNDNSIAVMVTCIKEADAEMEAMRDKVFSSATCEGVQQVSKKLQEVTQKVTYSKFTDDDFVIKSPDWAELTDGGEERILGLSKGVCSIIVDKHNALPEDIYNWLNTALEEKGDHELIDSSSNDDIYWIDYKFQHEENMLTAETKVFYCNYQSYVTQVLCVDDLVTEDYEEIRDEIIESAKCSKEYEIPTPKKIEEKKEEVIEEEPDIIEEIEDEIVKTNAGEEFGIDEEMVVYFINNNDFFNKIMRNFPKGNLVIEDGDRELKLRVKIGDDGKITRLEDGAYSDADITLIVPLRDALNIFSNAQNINPLTLLGFAVNVRTDPPETKNEVIQKVLRGEYN